MSLEVSSDEIAVAEAVAFRLNPVKWIGSLHAGAIEYDVSEMENSHIWNTIAMIESNRMKRLSCNGLTNHQWVKVFKNELTARRVHGIRK